MKEKSVLKYFNVRFGGIDPGFNEDKSSNSVWLSPF